MTNAIAPWYRIRAEAESDTAEIVIYDAIGESMWEEGVTARSFVTELRAITSSHISLRINSPGGSVFDGLAIATAIREHPATITSHVDGLAASIASVIALAADRVIIARDALFMIHNPRAGAAGEATELRRVADVLDSIRAQMLERYTERWNGTPEALAAALDAETWLTGAEAVDAGFADEIAAETRQMAACASFDFAALGFTRVPAALIAAAIPLPTTPPAAPPAREEPPAMPAATAPPAAVPRPHASAPRLTVGQVFAAALRRKVAPHEYEAMLTSLQAMAETPGDGTISMPGDVSGLLPEPIVQEIHSWLVGKRPVSALFGLASLPYSEGESFNWPVVVEYPNADYQTAPGAPLYLTNLKIDGVNYSKVTIGAKVTRPFQTSWTSPGIAAEVGKQLLAAYARSYEREVCADLVANVTGTVELDAAASAGAIGDAILAGIEAVDTVTEDGANCIIASRDQVRRLRGLRDVSGRPLYPLINPVNADGQVVSGVLQVEGLAVTTSPKLAAGTLIVGHTAGYRTFDDGGNYVTQDFLANLSTDEVVYGYGAFGMLDSDAFVKLTDTIP